MPENEGHVEIGFIPYQIEAPAHLAGFPRNILFAKAQATDGSYVGQVCYYALQRFRRCDWSREPSFGAVT